MLKHSHNNSNLEPYLVVSTDLSRPAVGMLTNDGNFMIAVTNGDGLEKRDSKSGFVTYDFAISTRNTATLHPEENHKIGNVLNLQISKTYSHDYIIYYKKIFQHSGYSYFVTNQKKVVSDQSSTYESKLVRICQNDTAYNSYADIAISCEYGYNLVQDVVLILNQGRPYLIGIFTKGEDPEKPSGDSVICGGGLEDIDEEIIEAKKYFLFNSSKDEDSERYLPNFYRRDIGDMVRIEYVTCDTAYSIFKYVIGKRAYQMKLLSKALAFDGILTLLYGTVLNSRTVVLAGTSTGKLHMMNLKDTNSLEIFDQTSVGIEPIKAIHKLDDDTLYVMTTNKVEKYATTDCAEFKTCHSVMKRRNPLCGWCVFKNRATRNSSTLCPQEEWLQSFGSCVKLELDVRGVQAGNPEKRFVEVKALYLPYRQNTKDIYSCRFSHDQREIGYILATRDDSTGIFSCKIPTNVLDYTEATLELIVNTDITLANTSFLFFKCDHFKRCGECVNTTGANCKWNLQKPECTNIDVQGLDIRTVDRCPRLDNNKGLNFIPRNNRSDIIFKASNLIQLHNFQGKFWCYIHEEEITVDGGVDFANSILTCNVRINSERIAKKEVQVSIKYGVSKEVSKEFDDEFVNTVTVYDCSELAEDCSQCKSLNTSRYTCSWCSNKNKCGYGKVCNEKCHAPKITKIIPRDGPVQGNTLVTIYGKELGTQWSDIISVHIEQKTCKILNSFETRSVCLVQNEDFSKQVPKCILCRTPEVDVVLTGQVVVSVNDSKSEENVTFQYKRVSVVSIYPTYGPKAGGTLVTIHGKNLGVGNRIWRVYLQTQLCLEPKVLPDLNLESSATFYIKCETSPYQVNTLPLNLSRIILRMDEKECYNGNLKEPFMILQNPNITGIRTSRQNYAFLSGGTVLTVTGRRIANGNVGKVISTYKGEQVNEYCGIPSEEKMLCKVPEAPHVLRKDVMERQNQTENRQKRFTCNGCIEVKISVNIDGLEKDFVIKYFRDPLIYKFGTNGEVLLHGKDKQQLNLMGDALNLVATKYDFNVTIGVAECTVITLTETELICLPPIDQPAPIDSDIPEVNVKVGNINVTLGYLEYEKKVEMIAVIGGATGGVLFILVIIFTIFFVKYKKVGKKAKKYEQNLQNIEMEIKKLAREDCLDMFGTMALVNKGLAEQEQVYPYHGYQQFACNVMFSVDFLSTDPVKLQAIKYLTENDRMKVHKAMDSLETLIYNKFFLVSVISTMEKEKGFSLEEKCNLAGYLCSVLMGKMDYLNEVLKTLMTILVQDSSAKKHKSLFIRCDSITEKLLSNWISLCLYPHMKSHSGPPLYLLYMANQKMMESGPIDAVTNEAKYTLSTEKLLMNWTSQDDCSEDLTFDATSLTLNVVVDNGDEGFKCKVLDCDTISQVKSKCLSQIYVNIPASQLQVKASALALELEEGVDGILKLRDVDNTSTRDGHWIRLNTLAHYSVKDDSCVTLVDQQGVVNVQHEDNVNLAYINIDGLWDRNIDSTSAEHDEKNPHRQKYWHLVKKEESSKQEKSAISDLYLNRLFKTKQSIMEYIRPLFDILLDQDRCPPPTKCLFDFFDYLGERYKVDSDTVHSWKSHSYANRAWANLMKMPNMLFDVSIPTYMNEDLDIISQAFIESFCLVPKKLTKDSPSQQLIFHHEINHYRDKVKEFYIRLKIESQTAEELNQYLTDVNKLQQQTTFNKASVLYMIYKQLKPYFGNILKDLSTNLEASVLGLDRKLGQVIAIMEEGNNI